MDKKQAKTLLQKFKHKDVIQAYIDGKEIECRHQNNPIWKNTISPEFHADWEYQVKHEPEPPQIIPFRQIDFFRLPRHIPLKRALQNSEYFLTCIKGSEVSFMRFEGSRMAFETYSYAMLAKEFFYTNQQGELVPCHHIQLEKPNPEEDEDED